MLWLISEIKIASGALSWFVYRSRFIHLRASSLPPPDGKTCTEHTTLLQTAHISTETVWKRVMRTGLSVYLQSDSSSNQDGTRVACLHEVSLVTVIYFCPWRPTEVEKLSADACLCNRWGGCTEDGTIRRKKKRNIMMDSFYCVYRWRSANCDKSLYISGPLWIYESDLFPDGAAFIRMSMCWDPNNAKQLYCFGEFSDIESCNLKSFHLRRCRFSHLKTVWWCYYATSLCVGAELCAAVCFMVFTVLTEFQNKALQALTHWPCDLAQQSFAWWWIFAGLNHHSEPPHANMTNKLSVALVINKQPLFWNVPFKGHLQHTLSHILSLHMLKVTNPVAEMSFSSSCRQQIVLARTPLQKPDSCGTFTVAACHPALALGHLAGAAEVLRD